MSKFSDLSGQTFGRLTVLHRVGTKSNVTTWACHCSCNGPNADVTVRRDHLRSGVTTSCGCVRRELAAHRVATMMIGQRFGRLVVIDRSSQQAGNATWHCQCDCGTRVIARSDHLASGTTKSCGCLVTDTFITHGESNTKLYRIWCAMKQRCLNPNSESYERYGGRGITICQEWIDSFESFRQDMGPLPSEYHTLERRDNNGPYSPYNCIWATLTEQQNNTRRNRRLTYAGESLTVAQWARRLGIPASTIRGRLKRHSVDLALSIGRIR